VGLAHLLTRSAMPIEIGPLQHDEVDVGEEQPVRCLRNGLWLAHQQGIPFAVLFTPAVQYGQSTGIHVEIAVPNEERAATVSESFLHELELRAAAGKTYRGRVISLEVGHDYTGRGSAVKVHRLHSVKRDEVILPEQTLALLERNITGFVGMRDRIKRLGLTSKKGVLFYGPPGTGKTHTIHYLASQLPEHTTLLITAEQVGIIEHYFRLARFLQPAMIVVEDADLIARAREHLGSACEEVLLNKLLNEMDGLREDADVLFLLTTNRPDQLEPALTARPGRIDQAIEFPLPDEVGRAKLVRLYARGLRLGDELLQTIVSKTRGASPAFIKELMRRAAQVQFEASEDALLRHESVEAALEDMLFRGGSLNVKLLGGAVEQMITGRALTTGVN